MLINLRMRGMDVDSLRMRGMDVDSLRMRVMDVSHNLPIYANYIASSGLM